ncbi:50S ribosomal protein L17 [Marinitoga sp. 1135]|uniref:Large ribosomal subunit protein bL17 n=1 Tax=Marinitoga piezophila (strain DSM 14283 / JCM 11233 / KA3) TaxID=443254 RepID=H2J775_MARPK|nr:MULTISPECIES: 50S ribosomal protein L17 [Marinitoga]AEX85267.1 ribosomal protein L17 [Marinitoga piezophila KA3]APT75752.1 50S ribosomal protein L17 [Marinitoga sp. 1137]NUU95495.1 50S ribosomal protein L17 [Marinitoga sp. 1135]NUU97422.1 50S ribosomal protein L17 [Marinitoga sp. 1138]
MRHRVKVNKLSRYASHRKALLKNLAREVFEHGSIITTTAKAKAVRPLVEKILTKAKEAKTTDNKDRSVALRRQINRYFNDRRFTNKVVDEIAPKFENRNGGYTRILKIGYRRGDAAELSLLQLVESIENKEEEKAE